MEEAKSREQNGWIPKEDNKNESSQNIQIIEIRKVKDVLTIQPIKNFFYK